MGNDFLIFGLIGKASRVLVRSKEVMGLRSSEGLIRFANRKENFEVSHQHPLEQRRSS